MKHSKTPPQFSSPLESWVHYAIRGKKTSLLTNQSPPFAALSRVTATTLNFTTSKEQQGFLYHSRRNPADQSEPSIRWTIYGVTYCHPLRLYHLELYFVSNRILSKIESCTLYSMHTLTQLICLIRTGFAELVILVIVPSKYSVIQH